MAVLEVYSDRWEVWANEKNREDQNGKKKVEVLKQYIDNYKKRMVRLLWLDLLRFHHPEADMKAWKSYSLTFPSIVIFSSGKSWSKKSETFTGSKEMSIWTFIKKIKAISSSNHIKLQI